MKTILVAAQKGGVGKTTIANELAFILEDMGKKVAFINADNQGGQIFPSKPVEADTDYRIVDTPGVLLDNLKDLIRASDIVLIPTNTGAYDIVPLNRIYEIVQAQGTQPAIVISGYDERLIVDRQFTEHLKNKGMYVIGSVPKTELLRQMNLAGKSVAVDAPPNPAGIRLTLLATSLIKTLEK